MVKGFWEQLTILLYSPTFLACIFSWFFAQFLKTLIKLFAGQVHSIKEIAELLVWRTGGMPSSHSALVACLCTCIGITSGIDSDIFVLSFCFFMITIRDAVGVRRANGIQAKMINRIGNLLKDQGLVQEYKNLKEVQGHRPMEVIVGSILGAFVGAGFLLL
ncbi:divergent PAP2 family protein [Treponema pectinovorum]|uniref:divergent PAP2 family protein n=1 Tax=Treponema pectinovorum TaxID=164 RepID=UPI003D8ADF29